MNSVILPEQALSEDQAKQVCEACHAWLMRSASPDTRSNYDRDLRQFLAFAGIPPEEPEKLLTVRPLHVSTWRDHLTAIGLTNSSVRRKMTVLRSLFSYLQSYGYVGANPAHSDFVASPAVPRDGKTVALSPVDCRRLLDAPAETTLLGIRDRALLAIFAYTGCRVGELVRLKVGSFKSNGVHKVLEVYGKGGKERPVPLHKEAEERLVAWLESASLREDHSGPLFRPVVSGRGKGKEKFASRAITRRAVQLLVKGYMRQLGLDPSASVHSLRVTALTTARERGCDIIDLQDFAGHADLPRTTLTYIRSRDRLGVNLPPTSFATNSKR